MDQDMAPANKNYLVALDTPGIQEYILETNKLREIRGASALIKKLTEVKILDVIQDIFGSIEKDNLSLVAGGGQFIVNTTEEQLILFRTALHELYVKETFGGLTPTCSYLPLDKDKPNSYKKTAANLFQRQLLQARSYSKEHSFIVPGNPFLHYCDSCNNRPGQFKDKFDITKNIILCGSCYQKRKMEKEKNSWQDFNDFFQKNLNTAVEFDHPSELSHLAESGIQDFALVYADGNSMGRIVSKFSNIPDFRIFAEGIDNAIRTAVFETLAELLQEHIKHLGIKSHRAHYPFEILVLGGDDCCVFIPAGWVLPFIHLVADRFESKTKEVFKDLADLKTISFCTLSFGVAFGRVNTPFYQLYRNAYTTMTSAKKEGRNQVQLAQATQHKEKAAEIMAPAMFDFHSSHYFGDLDVEQIRNEEFSKTDHFISLQARESNSVPSKQNNEIIKKITQRPYAVSKIPTLATSIGLMQTSIPPTKRQQMVDAVMQNIFAGTINLINILSHLNKAKLQDLIKDLEENYTISEPYPWKRTKNTENKMIYETPILDIIELTSYYNSKCNINYLNLINPLSSIK